jgi:hypothetical protein
MYIVNLLPGAAVITPALTHQSVYKDLKCKKTIAIMDLSAHLAAAPKISAVIRKCATKNVNKILIASKLMDVAVMGIAPKK